jgi:hypothetical protein
MAKKQPQITMKEFQKRTQALILSISNAKVEAGALGLFKTMHAFEEPMTVIGYEVAEVLEGGHHVRPTKPGFWDTENEEELINETD